MPTRVRWTKARVEDGGVVLLEFWDSPDVEPVEAVFDEQEDYVGLVLRVGSPPGTTWMRQMLDRHVAEIRLPIVIGGRPLRDVKPRRPPGTTVAARHYLGADPT